ncbi:glycosyltransferase [Planotetraspora sp. GP83]|uniref:glycosyltransferase n=1 Tax=Planotetraspora sp. GP83 TaxID=3156264 RepID=UPI003516F075
MIDPTISVIVPAFNEADYLPRYLPTVLASLRLWEEATGQVGEVIVVDNASTDTTPQVAEQLGARVVHEPQRGIGRARNTGARAAHGEYLVFVDADVEFPLSGVRDIADTLRPGRCAGPCVGGAIPPEYEPSRAGTRLLVAAWALYRRHFGGAQGVCQFATREAFDTVRGYREDMFMSEDVEFFARLTRLGAARQHPVVHLTHLRVRPSNRRFERWPSWRIWWWCNPITANLARTSPRFWRHWYDSTIR